MDFGVGSCTAVYGLINEFWTANFSLFMYEPRKRWYKGAAPAFWRAIWAYDTCFVIKKKKRWYRNEVGMSLVAISTTKNWNIALSKKKSIETLHARKYFLKGSSGLWNLASSPSLFSCFFFLMNFCCIKTNDNHPRMNKESVTKERAGNILGGIISN